MVDALVSQGHILPILDGLDEAAPEVRETFIRAVHQSMDGSTELILTSPYGAIAALAEVASNPLGLWLIRAAYISPATDPARLLDDKQFTTGTALRAHLFDRLVAASISARPPSSDPAQLFRPRHEYGPEEVEAWLRFLAQNLDRWKRRDYDWARDTAALAAPFPWTVPVADFLRRTVPVLREPPRPVRRKPRQYSICGTDGGTGVTLRLGLAVACGDSVRPVGDQRLRDVWPNGRRAS